MGIFDKLNFAVSKAINSAVNSAVNSIGNKTERFTFEKLPESAAQLQALPEASLDSPFKTAALSVLALCAYGADKATGVEMLNFLKGPRPLSPAEIAFLDDRFRDNQWYVPFSYFKGATPENNYTPTEPFTIEVSSNPNSGLNEGYMTLWLKSGGADNPRQITLRMKGDGRWFLWEQFIMVGIRTPKAQDPWA
mgnify:CR=1 FL=1